MEIVVDNKPVAANWNKALHEPVLLGLVAYLRINAFVCPWMMEGVSYNKLTVIYHQYSYAHSDSI